MEKTAVEWLIDELIDNGFSHLDLAYEIINKAKEIEEENKIQHLIAKPLGHVSHMIEKYGIDGAIEEYECKVANDKDSEFWKDCLRISKLIK